MSLGAFIIEVELVRIIRNSQGIKQAASFATMEKLNDKNFICGATGCQVHCEKSHQTRQLATVIVWCNFQGANLILQFKDASLLGTLKPGFH